MDLSIRERLRMIYVERPDPPEGFEELAEKELRKNKNRLVATPVDPKFVFSAYSEPFVKKALADLFGGKCAYCETRYAPAEPGDVEHFRPKGEIVTPAGPKKPGYWWLAAEWSNLLPSCTDCNRERYVEFHDGTTLMSGKGNHFPLADESVRAGDIGQEGAESPLLLNPCEDDPEDFLAFEIRNGLCLAVPRPGAVDPFGRGHQSIKIYGLNRKELVQERSERVVEVTKALQCIRDNLDILLAVVPGSIPAEKATAVIKRELDAVRGYVSPRARYTAAALAFVIEEAQLLRDAAGAVAVAPVVRVRG